VLGSIGAVVLVVLLVAAGLVTWRLLAPGGGTTSAPLRILPVTGAKPGACPPGGPGTAAVDGKTCYRLAAPGMTVRKLESAEVTSGQSGDWTIQIRFDDADARRFAVLTGTYRGRRLALVSAGRVISAPTVQESITAGAVQITGNFTRDEAEKIAARLPA